MVYVCSPATSGYLLGNPITLPGRRSICPCTETACCDTRFSTTETGSGTEFAHGGYQERGKVGARAPSGESSYRFAKRCPVLPFGPIALFIIVCTKHCSVLRSGTSLRLPPRYRPTRHVAMRRPVLRSCVMICYTTTGTEVRHCQPLACDPSSVFARLSPICYSDGAFAPTTSRNQIRGNTNVVYECKKRFCLAQKKKLPQTLVQVALTSWLDLCWTHLVSQVRFLLFDLAVTMPEPDRAGHSSLRADRQRYGVDIPYHIILRACYENSRTQLANGGADWAPSPTKRAGKVTARSCLSPLGGTCSQSDRNQIQESLSEYRK